MAAPAGRVPGAAVVPGGFGPEGREDDMDETRRERERRRKAQLGRKGYEQDEAPMGLFDVARGAARAIGKSAFPLRATQQGTGGIQINQTAARSDPRKIQNPKRSSMEESNHQSQYQNQADGDDGQQQRLRKRDMVSNMVTSGLVGSLGWVLGAQPVEQEQQQQQQHQRYEDDIQDLSPTASSRLEHADHDLLPAKDDDDEVTHVARGGQNAAMHPAQKRTEQQPEKVEEQEKEKEREQDEWQDW